MGIHSLVEEAIQVVFRHVEKQIWHVHTERLQNLIRKMIWVELTKEQNLPVFLFFFGSAFPYLCKGSVGCPYMLQLAELSIVSVRKRKIKEKRKTLGI